MMDILNFLGGKGFFMILALFVVLVLLYNKLKVRKYHRDMNKKHKKG